MVIYSPELTRESQKAFMAISTRSSSQANPNFSMPVFKWGSRKQFTFRKPDSADDSLASLHKISSTTGKPFSGAGGFRSGGELPRQPCFSSSSSSHERPPLIAAPQKRTKPEYRNEEQNDELLKERDKENKKQKLLIHLRHRCREDEEEKEVGVTANVTEKIVMVSEPESPKLWNRRTRSATCRLAVSEIEQQQQHQQRGDDSSPLALQKLSQRMVRGGSSENEVVKFSISLSRREIEEDLFAITGNRPSQRPKKRRPRMIQRKIDAIFPGLWLADITPDTYKVADNPETAKK